MTYLVRKKLLSADVRGSDRNSIAPWRLVALLVLSVLVLAACGGDGEDDAGGGAGGGSDGPIEVTIALPGGGVAWYGWFAAEALGYWEEEGLEVDIVETGGSGEAAQLLAAGEVDVAEAATDRLIPVMDRTNIYPFYNFWEQENRRWVVPEESEVQEISDLAGTTVGVTELAGAEVPLVQSLLASEGILDEVDIVAVSNRPAAVLTALENDRIQSYAGETGTLISMAGQGVETRSIMPLNLQKGPIVPTAASEEFYEEHPDAPAKIARGIAKGSLFCITDVEACVDVIAEERPEYVEDRDLAIETVRDGYIPITAPEPQDGKYIFGTTNTVEGWELYAETYSKGPSPTVKNPEKYDFDQYVLELVDEINDFDYDAVVAQAEDYESE